MTKKNLRNLIKATSHIINRKKMYKAGKQWVVASLSTLAILGLGASALNPVAVNANASSHPHTSHIKKSSVDKEAKALYKRIVETPYFGNMNAAAKRKHRRRRSKPKKRVKPNYDKSSYNRKYYYGGHSYRYDTSVSYSDQPLLAAYADAHSDMDPWHYIAKHDSSSFNHGTWSKPIYFLDRSDNDKQVGFAEPTFKNDIRNDSSQLVQYANLPKDYTFSSYQPYEKSSVRYHKSPTDDSLVHSTHYNFKPQSNGTVGITNTGYNEHIVREYADQTNSTYSKDVVFVHRINNKSNVTINYTDNGTSKGSHSFNGQKGNSFMIGAEPAGLPDGYHVVNPEQSVSYDGGTHNVPIAKNKQPAQNNNHPSKKNNEPIEPSHKAKAKARIHYVNKGHIKGRHTFTGNKHGHFHIGKHPLGLPDGYRIAHPNRRIAFNNKVSRVHIIKNIKSYKPGRHFRWFKVSKHGVWVHTTLGSVGKRSHYFTYLKPRHGVYYRIIRIYKVHKNGKRYVRYAFRFIDHAKHGKIYYVSGNPNYTVNSYWQKSSLRHRRHTIKVIRGCAEYKSRYYDHYTKVRNVPVGTTLHVKRVIMIGRKHDCQTRFVLDNGRYITANKNFTWLLK